MRGMLRAAVAVAALAIGTAPVAAPVTQRIAAAAPPGLASPVTTPVMGPTPAPAIIEGALGPIPPDPPRNVAYAHGGYLVFLARVLLILATLAIVVVTGSGGRLQALAERLVRGASLRVAACTAMVAVLLALVTLPLDIYGGFVRERRFGFMNQGFGAWLLERGEVLALVILVEMIVVPVLYALMRRAGRAWWLPAAVIVTSLVVVGQVIVPVYIAPIFNAYTPLAPSDLKTRILEMARAQGIPADEVYEVDASRQSEHTNAYVAGLFGAQRIVLYDTLLRRMAPREILFVMGHEMGHYVLNHVWKTIALLAPVFAAGFLVSDRIVRRLCASRPRWGIAGIERPASLPLLLLVIYLASFAVRPAVMAWSRSQERAADLFGMQVTRDPEAAASTFLKFAEVDLSEIHVDPLLEWALFTHPSTAHRIEEAQDWARRHGVGGPGAGR